MSPKKIVSFAPVFLSLIYPFVIFFGLRRAEFQQLSAAVLCIGVVLILLGLFTRGIKNRVFMSGTIITTVGVLHFFTESPNFLLIYPVIVNVLLFALFAASLIFPPSVIEKLARLSTPDLPPHAVKYTRNVTLTWCVFFICNGLIAAYTISLNNLEVWTFYNGFVSYVLIGVLLVGELAWRRFKTKREL